MIAKNRFIFLIFLFSIALNSSNTHKQIKVFNIDPIILRMLSHNDVHIDHSYLDSDNNLIFDISEYDESIIESLAIEYEILINDLDAHYKSRLTTNYTREFGVGSMGGYYTFEEIVDNLDVLHNQYPHIIGQKVSIGQSIEGNDIWAIKVGNYSNEGLQKPQVLYTGLHHAREPMSYMNLFYYLYWLCENYQLDDDATKILDTRELWFIPAVNPDGLIYNEENDPMGGGWHRKNMRSVCNPGYSYYTQNNEYYNPGVDLNRNYNYQWGLNDEGSSPDECSWTYRGEFSFSEPETETIKNFIENNEFQLAFNYHSYGNLLIHPFGYSYENQVPEEDLLFFKELGKKMVQFNNYTLGAGPEILYPVNGEACDWMYGEHGIFAYTPEIGSYEDGFWPATDRIVPLADENLYPNKLLSIYAGAVIEPILSSDEGPFKQGLSYPLYLKIKNIGLSEVGVSSFGSNGNILITSSDFDIQSEAISISNIEGRSEVELGLIGSFTIPVNIQDGEKIEINVAVDSDYVFYNNSSLSILVGDPSLIIVDDFEEESGWYVEGNASDGIWTRDIPVQAQINDINYMPEFDHTDNGEYCFVTGSENFNDDRYNDVDNGETILYSPIYNLSSYSKALISYWKYYTNNLGDNPDSDFWRVHISNNNWDSWYSIEETIESNSNWSLYELLLNQDDILFTDQMQFRFIAEDINGGSFIEAGIDDFSVFLFDDIAVGDINQDGNINISDIIVIVNFIVGTIPPTYDQFLVSDINSDNNINIQDIILLVNIILS